jgi:hypothetical protein
LLAFCDQAWVHLAGWLHSRIVQPGLTLYYGPGELAGRRTDMKVFLRTMLAAAVAVSLWSSASQAGYLDVSANWSAPSTVPMSKKAALSVVGECTTASVYANMAGKTSGAMIVAGPHTTPTDKKTHLTVRLYKSNDHEKSCHVYTGKNNSFASCSCEYKD